MVPTNGCCAESYTVSRGSTGNISPQRCVLHLIGLRQRLLHEKLHNVSWLYRKTGNIPPGNIPPRVAYCRISQESRGFYCAGKHQQKYRQKNNKKARQITAISFFRVGLNAARHSLWGTFRCVEKCGCYNFIFWCI